MKYLPRPAAKALPQKLPILAVIGFQDMAGGDWRRLRGLQFSTLVQHSFARVLGHAMAALLVLQTYCNSIHPAWLAGWAVALAASLIIGGWNDRLLIAADTCSLARSPRLRQVASSFGMAVVWSVPMIVFGPIGSPSERMALWTVLAMLITGMAVSFAAMPLATVLFTSIVGTSALGAFLYAGDLTSAAVAAIFIAIVIAGAIEAARTFLGARVAEAGIAEKSEVVSLLLREFEEGDADWLWQVDSNRRVQSASKRLALALSCDPEEIEGKPLIQLIAGSAWENGHFHPSLHDLAERLKRRESFSHVLVRVQLKGTNRWWELSAAPRLDENGNFVGFRGVGSDVTRQRESAEKIAYHARYDTLTGLPNRLMLTEAVGDALSFAEKWRKQCAFLMIDLDRFKAVNDTLGHLVGDQLLAMVSDRLRLIIKDGEVCGRLGGDEFAVIMRDVGDGARVDELAQAIMTTLSQPYDVGHHTLYVGASVGSAMAPRDGATVEMLLRNSDLALYRAKDGGGGRHCTYEPSLHAHAEERRKLEALMRHALERDEFSLLYQPVIDAKTEKVVSFEALLRWSSIEHGSIDPLQFIPLAEDTRLIVPIGEWVLRKACLEAKNWPDNIKVAVNVSGEQLLDPYFFDAVVNALSSAALPAQRLEIEVTERIFVRDGTSAQQTLENLMGIGCGITLDDFGTGYSSLSYLRRMRFSTIKVDRGFVQGAAQGNPESLAIVRAVVAIGDSLEITTTAEGVENEAEFVMVRTLGCEKIQGFYFGRPMPASKAQAMFGPPCVSRFNAG